MSSFKTSFLLTRLATRSKERAPKNRHGRGGGSPQPEPAPAGRGGEEDVVAVFESLDREKPPDSQ
jgi:hypothetical protein